MQGALERWVEANRVVEQAVEARKNLRVTIMTELKETGFFKAAGLTDREAQVLDGIHEEQTNKEIAQHLNISERTVKFFVSKLLIKFDVLDRRALRQATRELKLEVKGELNAALATTQR